MVLVAVRTSWTNMRNQIESLFTIYITIFGFLNYCFLINSCEAKMNYGCYDAIWDAKEIGRAHV